MRLPPYAKDLIARRKAGELPWLVVVTMGDLGDRRLMRMPAFEGDKGVARIWVPDDFQIADADLRWAVGLDVFVAPWCEAERLSQFMEMLWRARPSTLWQLDAGFTATRLYPIRADGRGELGRHDPQHQKLDGNFRETVRRTREHALLVADLPLFQDSLFSEERRKLLAA